MVKLKQWRAVKIAKDVNTSELPNKMYQANAPIEPKSLSDTFRKYFKVKIDQVSATALI